MENGQGLRIKADIQGQGWTVAAFLQGVGLNHAVRQHGDFVTRHIHR